MSKTSSLFMDELAPSMDFGVLQDIWLDRVESLKAKYIEQGLLEQDAQDRAEREMVEGHQ